MSKKVINKRCLCITISGNRCSREGTYGGYCFQHNGKCTKSIKMKRSPKKKVALTKKKAKPTTIKTKNPKKIKIPKELLISQSKIITFTGIPDVDRHILLQLEPKDLLSACSVDAYAKALCNNEFWKNKIRLEFPKHITKEHKSYKRAYNILHLRRFSPLTLAEKLIKKKMDKTSDTNGFSNIYVEHFGATKESFNKFLQKIGVTNILNSGRSIEFRTNNPKKAYKALKFLANKRNKKFGPQEIRDNLRIDGEMITFTFDYFDRNRIKRKKNFHNF